MRKAACLSALALAARPALAQPSDPCHSAHADQKSCDADTSTGGGCVWCKCAALPSSCWTKANSKKLPPAVYQCDSGASRDSGSQTTNPPTTPPVFKTWSSPVTSTCVGAACVGSASKGTMAYSESQNKTAWRPAAQGGRGVPTVVDFNAKAAYFMTGVAGTCDFQCPLVSGSTECNEQTNPNDFCLFDYLHKIKYVDSDATSEHYHMDSGIGPLVMAKYDYYFDKSTQFPTQVVFQAQPFGKWIGNITTHYDGFSTAEPDASLFAVPNMKYCQKGSDAQCGDIDTLRGLLQAAAVVRSAQKR